MVQVGLNTGARDVCLLGWAQSFTAKLSEGELVHHDLEAIGAASITWSLIQSAIPTEIIDPIKIKLETDNFPHIATRNVEPGMFNIM